MESTDRRMTAVVLGLAVVLFVAFLGSVGIFDPEEGRHVAIPVAMLRTGDFVVPHLQGFPYLEKPPLTYWMTAISFAVLGRSETAARLPVALHDAIQCPWAADVGLAKDSLGRGPKFATVYHFKDQIARAVFAVIVKDDDLGLLASPALD